MAFGTVKWFNNRKGYGFIQPEDGGRDVFVHISALEEAGFKTLNENEKIEYELTESRGKTVANELKIQSGSDNTEHSNEYEAQSHDASADLEEIEAEAHAS